MSASNVELVTVTSRTEKTYTLTVSGAEVRDCQYSTSGRRYRPERVTVIKRDGNVSRVIISGTVQKKDGTDGSQRHEEYLHNEKNWPSWLGPMIRGLA